MYQGGYVRHEPVLAPAGGMPDVEGAAQSAPRILADDVNRDRRVGLVSRKIVPSDSGFRKHAITG